MARSPQVPESCTSCDAGIRLTAQHVHDKMLEVITCDTLKKFLLCIDAKYRYDCIIAPFEVAFKD